MPPNSHSRRDRPQPLAFASATTEPRLLCSSVPTHSFVVAGLVPASTAFCVPLSPTVFGRSPDKNKNKAWMAGTSQGCPGHERRRGEGEMRALVVGGSLGGLFAACMLLRSG